MFFSLLRMVIGRKLVGMGGDWRPLPGSVATSIANNNNYLAQNGGKSNVFFIFLSLIFRNNIAFIIDMK